MLEVAHGRLPRQGPELFGRDRFHGARSHAQAADLTSTCWTFPV